MKLILKNAKNYFEICLAHDGFKRINHKISKHKRRVIIKNKSIYISDTIYGEGSIKLNSHFHFPKDLEINNEIQKRSDELCVDFILSSENKNSNSQFKIEDYSGSIDPFLKMEISSLWKQIKSKIKSFKWKF